MSDLVSIAGGAVAAYQRALGTVSNNIANVDSEGYTRQETTLLENAPRQYGTSYLGTGVNVAGVRRAYDAFIENSLRSATTELGTQEPLVTYANRVTDVLGNEDVGLLSAFDQFFDSARQLATDSSSVILREQFLSKTDALAQRFNTLSTQLGLVDVETREAIDAETRELNTLSEQMALVNKQLAKSKTLERQPSDLLDQRDQLLRKMSALAKISVSERPNGEVSVSIGSAVSKGVIVDRDEAQPVYAVFSDSSVGKVDLVIRAGSPSAEPVTGFSGGSLSGLLNFRSQLLQPVFDDLDNLARQLVSEVNGVHAEGIDLQGRSGQALLSIEPQFSLSIPMGSTDASVSAQLTDAASYVSNTLRLDFDATAGQTSVVGLSGEFSVDDQVTVTLNGVRKAFSLEAPIGQRVSGAPTLPLTLDEVQTQLRQFLEGGNGASLDGAFGRQISVTEGPGNQLLVSSETLGSFGFEVSVLSDKGAASNLKETGRWTITDTVTGQQTIGTSSASLNGITLQLGGAPKNGETLFLEMQNSAAAGIRLATNDPNRVAAASRFRVIESEFNPGSADAVLRETPEDYSAEDSLRLDRLVGPAPALKPLVSSDIAENALAYTSIPAVPLAVVPAGYQDVTFYLDELGANATELQVLTRDGRHIVGRPLADDLIAEAELELGRTLYTDEKEALIDEAGETFLFNAKRAGVAFADGSTYSAQYLNAQDSESYRDMEVFYGVKAKVQEIAQLTEDHVVGEAKVVKASATAFDEPTVTATLGQVIFKEGELVLNGLPMPGLKLTNVGGVATLQLLKTDEFGVQQATALTLGSVPAPAETPTDPGDYDITVEHLALWMASSGSPRTTVAVVQLEGYDPEDPIDPDATLRYGLQLSRAMSTEPDAKPYESEIRLGLGETGNSLSLAKLGFRPAVYLSGEVKEDLYLFASGENTSASFNLNATFTEGSREPIETLRTEPFQVVFTSPSQYQIVDVNSDTVVADRRYDPNTGIAYRGVTLSLDAVPVAGDRFLVDGDQDGVGNNNNVLRIVSLQTERLDTMGGTTLAEAYSNTVSDAGNIAFQASIAQKALEVVKDQAVQARDRVSGVSLDEEAADLIRYQQAYQASAKIMQTASTMFDAILAIR